jgi:hypothetical protein
MYPVNQVFLGADPLLGNKAVGSDIEEQLRMLESRRQALESMKQLNTQAIQKPIAVIWNEIDSEMSVLNNDQKEKLFSNPDYVELYTSLQMMIQDELLELVKYKIEASPKGKALLEEQLKLLKKLKARIIENDSKDMELFRRFQEASKANPELTYEQFKQTIK